MTTKQIEVEIVEADIDLLHKQIKDAVGANFHGVVYDKNGYRLVVDESITPGEIAQARAIAAAHNPADKPELDIATEKDRAKRGDFKSQLSKVLDPNITDLILRLQAEIDELKAGKK